MWKFHLPKLHIEFERWKWNTKHQVWVSTFGNVRSKNNEPLKYFCENKYIKVRTPDRSIKSIHWLVMDTFNPTKDTKLTIDHLDSNTRNNKLSNLKWCTRTENSDRTAPPTIKNQIDDFEALIANNQWSLHSLYSHGNVRIHSDEELHALPGIPEGAKLRNAIHATLNGKAYCGQRWQLVKE